MNPSQSYLFVSQLAVVLGVLAVKVESHSFEKITRNEDLFWGMPTPCSGGKISHYHFAKGPLLHV